MLQRARPRRWRRRRRRLPALRAEHGCLGLLLAASCLYADEPIYRWRDAEGGVHYTQTAPEGVNAERVDPRRINTIRQEPPAAPAASRSGEQPAAQAQESSRAALDAAEAKQLEAMRKGRRAQCRHAREQFEQLTTHPRIRVHQADGTARMLTEQARQARIEAAKEAIVVNCQSARARPAPPAGR